MIPANFKKFAGKPSGVSTKKQFIKSKLSKLRKEAMLKKSASSKSSEDSESKENC